MPSSVLALLDLGRGMYTIGPMGLNTKDRQELLYPYVEIMQDCRKLAGLSQAKLGEEVGFSMKYVTLIEGQRRTPALDSLLALMAAAGVERATAERLVKEVLDSFEWQS